MRAFVAACFVAGLIAVGAVVVLDYFVQSPRRLPSPNPSTRL